MKKITILLCLIATVLSITACTVTEINQNTNGNNSQETSSDETCQITNAASSSETTAPSTEIAFEKVSVVDNEFCKIEITGIDSDNFWGYTLKVHLENYSADKLYMFSVENAWINGVECDPFFATEVAAGKKANDSISFSTATLEENGITEFTDIELCFRVYDSDDWSAEEVAIETVHIYPFGEENATNYVRGEISTDHVVLDNEFVTLIVTGYEWDDIWGYTTNLYIVNKTDLALMFSVDNVSVNGYMVDPFFATTASAYKSKFSSISWSEDLLLENDITEVESIEFSLRVYNSDDLFTDDLVNITVTLTP